MTITPKFEQLVFLVFLRVHESDDFIKVGAWIEMKKKLVGIFLQLIKLEIISKLRIKIQCEL